MRKMKKSRILWLAVWLCLALSGCAKTESASEIMAKVQAKQMESEAVQSVAMNGQLKMTTQGMTLEFPMDLVIQTQPAEKQGEPALHGVSSFLWARGPSSGRFIPGRGLR